MKKVIAILTTREDIALWDLLRKETETATFVGFWGKNEVNKTECEGIFCAINHFCRTATRIPLFLPVTPRILRT